MGQSPPLEDQRLHIKPVTVADLTGKVICVTGANTGLGFEAAKHFARMNPQKLIMTVRDQEKGNKALKQLIEETNFHRAEVWLLDLNSFSSVQQFADKAVKELDRLDFLVENAAMLPGKSREVTKDGWEVGLQVNNLSQELLVLLLVPKMLETAKRFSAVPRIVVVSSDVHFWITEADPELMNSTNIHETLSSKEYCIDSGKLSKRYQTTKLLNLFFVRAISAHLPPSLLVNAVNPGFCISELRRSASAEETARYEAMEREVGLTSEEGGRNIVYGVTGGYGNPEEEEKLRAKFISLAEVIEESDFSLSKEGYEMQNRIWDETLEILTKVDPRVGDIAKEYLV
ncbi:hypothetical protein C8J56DRAFT_833656 [Mycena floridula]|nr:hypothetical protein C8J56DRAFT_833656 [Mycena floridula]